MSRAKLTVLLLGSTLVIGCASAPAPGVAPWDVPDGPNPYPSAPAGSPPAGDPKRLVRSSGLSGTTDNGYTIRLVSIARKELNSGFNALPDSIPVWAPDGAPLKDRVQTGMIGRPGGVLVDRGSRFLTFEITCPKRGQVDVMGYVPDGARENTPTPEFHGWDPAHWIYAMPRPTPFQIAVVVDDRSASHYRFAVADGEWKIIASGTLPTYRRETETLLTGPWGQVRHIVHPRPSATSKWTLEDEYGRYVAEPASLAPDDELRLRFLGRPGAGPRTALYAKGTPFVVESRPWHWVELSGIHYNPDPAKWAKGYWGDEGTKAVSRVGGTSLQALIRPVTNTFNGWDPGDVYAPDGKLWRGHPEPELVSPKFSGGNYPPGSLVAAFELEPDRVGDDRPARIEAFDANTSKPGQSLGKSLAKTMWSTRPSSQMLVPASAAPYIQFAVRYGDEGWKKAGEIAVPKVVARKLRPDEAADYDSSRKSETLFCLILRSTGQADLFFASDTERSRRSEALVRWPADDNFRLVARLKDGRRLPLSQSSVGVSGDGSSYSHNIEFNLTSEGALYNAAWHGVDKTRVRLEDVAVFDVETKGFSDPIYLVAHRPIP